MGNIPAIPEELKTEEEIIEEHDAIFENMDPLFLAALFIKPNEESLFDFILRLDKEEYSILAIIRNEEPYTDLILQIIFKVVNNKLDGYSAKLILKNRVLKIYEYENGFSSNKMYDKSLKIIMQFKDVFMLDAQYNLNFEEVLIKSLEN